MTDDDLIDGVGDSDPPDDDVMAVVCAADLAALGASAPVDEVHKVGADLVRRWQEPHRVYHTLRHLAEMLAALGELWAHGELAAPQVVRLRVAAWYHDAVYEPASPAGGNEEASAVLALNQLDAAGLPLSEIETVATLVAATATHDLDHGAAVPGAAAFLDADLWILAAPSERYEEYTAQVRREYAGVPDEAFRAGRARFLDGLAGRARLYATAHARAAWEPAARANIAAESARLT